MSRELDTRPATIALLLLPGALTVYLSFNAGGFFPKTVAFIAMIVTAAVALRVAGARKPFLGLSKKALVAGAALLLFAGWTLLSCTWSHSTSRSLIEFDRAMLYALVLLLFGSIGWSPGRVQWLVRGMALAIFVVGAIALTTRILPNVWPTSADVVKDRLGYPLTYWNALGLLVGLGLIFCTYLTTSLREPRVVRVLAAAPIPVLASTLLFTFSRGAIAAAILGILTYVVIGRPRGLLSGTLAVAPPTAAALIASYDADLLASTNPTTPAAVSQGHHVAAIIGACVLGALALRSLGLVLDAWLADLRLPRIGRPVLAGVGLGVCIALVGVGVAAGVPSRLDRQYHQFVHGKRTGNVLDFRTRLTSPANNGRLDQWDVALDSFERRKIDGTGAGTYALLWARNRPVARAVLDAHSLYAEVLGELGIVGLTLLLVALGTIIVGIAARARGRYRSVHAAVLAAALAWAVHAGVDWDWEMPAVTLWVFAAGGLALATPVGSGRGVVEAVPAARAATALALLAVAVIPALLMLSESRIAKSTDRYDAGNCPGAISSAGSAVSILSVRPEPYWIRAFCEAKLGRGAPSVEDMQRAIDRDPKNWRYRYGLALVRGAAGLDPRPAVADAARLNPLEPVIEDAKVRFATRSARAWRRQARLILTDRQLVRQLG